MKMLIRADADASVGLGHFMRCLALAQAWKDRGGETVFLMQAPPEGLTDRLEAGMKSLGSGAERGTPEDARQTAEVARREKAGWVVLDGYEFKGQTQRSLKEAGLKVLALDDTGHAESYFADIVLNPNAGADAALYARRQPETRLLLGTQYLLFRKEFAAWASWERENPAVARKVLVTLGGSDPNNVTEKVLKVMNGVRLPGLEVTVVLGSGNPNFLSVEKAAAKAGFAVRILRDVRDMARVMSEHDVAVTSVGTTCWELAFMKMPSCVVASFDYQKKVLKDMGSDAFLPLGWWEGLEGSSAAARIESLLNDKPRRDRMSAHGRKIADGKGAERIVSEMLR